ncbi:hypothetical protein BWI96_07805 [Siphonobacter sp. SORGH_AS_0500]|uniref:outer membrane beta-barrel protein n=1 Tax=Siphonobacter sp. SORGH_AS_0500 TaxID=1864824 RepID=UPI000CB8A980|nr:outer membrane beta-barrel protein [Siphonobacter sp. SORGH_AS_0500]PKK37242.1 hypothetical protein BWI96_07805 [Siphonobacter sp. SORGH_AS_0500]
MRFLWVLILICGVWSWASAQVQVRGRIQDSDTRVNLSDASVTLFTFSDSVLVKGARSNEAGQFILSGVTKGKYHLVISYVGYQNYSSVLQVNTSDIQLDTIPLLTQASTLAEVVIRRQAPPVTVKKDTIEYNPEAFQTEPSAVIEKLLGKLPGITVDKDGNIKAQGQDVPKILVDGQPFFDGDPKMATKNLPVDIVEKIQLIDQKSERTQMSGMDDGSRSKTINIVTKKDRRKGLFGDQEFSIGPDQSERNPRYGVRLNLNRFQESQQFSVIAQADNTNSGPGSGSSINRTLVGGVNYQNRWGKKTDLGVNYRANRVKSLNDQQSIRTYALPDTSYQVRESSSSHAGNTTHSLNLHFNHEFDSLTSFRLNSNVSLLQSGNLSHRQSQTFPIGSEFLNPINQSSTENTTDNQSLNGSVNAFLNRNFHKKGRNVMVTYTLFLNHQQNEGLTKSTNEFFGQRQNQTINQENEQTTRSSRHQVYVSYSEPLSEKNRLEFHYRFQKNPSYSNREVRNYNETTGRYDRFNDSLSNRFRSSYPSHAAGVLFQRNQGQNLFNLGMDVQQASLSSRSTSQNITKDFISLLPTAMVSFKVKKDRYLRLHYQGQTQAPTVDQLQPVADNTNPLLIRLGNPDLRQEFHHSMNLNYNSFNSTTFENFFLNINANQVTNKIIQSVRFDEQGVQTTLPLNTNGHYMVSGNVNYGRQLEFLKLQVNTGSSINYNRSLTLVNGQVNQANSLLISPELQLNSSYQERLGYNLRTMLTYQSARYSLQSQRNTSFINTSVSASFYYEWDFYLRLSTDATYQHYGGNTAGPAQRYTLWNVTVSQKFLKKQQAEMQIRVFDLLNQNRSVTRNVTELYTEERQNRVLSRYFLVSFMYHFRNFGGMPTPNPERKTRSARR